ncbi:MAG: SPFH domain-containing protein [Clostridia bacterium]|nr:SPFH domain-containing protein [Clostridia bacterium]
MALLNVIEQEMTNEQLVVRNHIEDFNAKSQLIVYESQEALFYKNGQALDLFGPGRHELKSENLPFFKRIFSHLFDGKTPLPCEVYFINKVNVLNVLWGTDSPIPLEDPKHPLLLHVRANGQTGIRVIDSRRFTVKVVGQLKEFTVEEVRRSIKSMMMTSIKECIAIAIMEGGVSITEISTKLSELSRNIQAKLNEYVADLGIAVDHFAINAILPSEGDLEALKKMKDENNETNIEAYRIRKLSEARAHARNAEGYTYQEERRFDVLETAAQNEGVAGAFMNMGMGFGMGNNVGKAVNTMAQNLQQPAAPAAAAGTKTCPQCNSTLPATAKFCFNCGQQMPQGPRFCPECGTKCVENSKFCSNCGTRLEAIPTKE